MKIIDLTHTFTPEMPVFPGDDLPSLKESVNTENNIVHYTISTGMHIGTHMDAPLHMVPGGKKLSEINPDKFLAKGHVIDARGAKEIGSVLLENMNISAGDCVLIYTRYDRLFRKPEFYETYPDLTEDFAKKLVELKIAFVGMDTPSPDKAPYNVHQILLKQEILIIEGLAHLEKLLNVKNFEVIALPAKFETEAAPVRVIAKIIE